MKTTIHSILTITATAAILGAAGCSSLDPNIGPVNTDQPVEGDAGGDVATDGDDTPGEGMVSFGRDIRPLIERPRDAMPKGCKSCHYSTEANHTGVDLSGFDLSTLSELRKGGGSSGARIIIPGKPNESVLVQVLRGQYAYAARMPKGNAAGFWTDEEVNLVARWIAEGAKGAASE